MENRSTLIQMRSKWIFQDRDWGAGAGWSEDISMHLKKFLDCESVIKVTWDR